MTLDALQLEVQNEENKVEAAEVHFQDEVEKLQAKYEELSKEKEDAMAKVKTGGLGLMKSVMKSMAAPEKKDEL